MKNECGKTRPATTKPRVRVNDGDGHWVDESGDLMTTAWTSLGWLDLPDAYECVGQTDGHEEDGLNMTIMYQGKPIRVQSADFENEYH